MGFADGSTAPVTIGAIYDQKGAIGDLVVPTELWTAHAIRPLGAQVVLISLDDPAAIDQVRAGIAPLARRYGSPTVEDRQEYLDSVAAQVNQMLTIVYVLLGLAVVIALLGIANTLALSIHERTRELGVLRAVGQTRRQLRAMVRWESFVVAGFGTVAGLGLGTLVGWGLVRASAESLDLTTFAVPTTQFAVILVVGAAAGVVAALRPARRASRLDVLGALSAD